MKIVEFDQVFLNLKTSTALVLVKTRTVSWELTFPQFLTPIGPRRNKKTCKLIPSCIVVIYISY